MANKAITTIRIDEDIKAGVEPILQELGLSLSGAVNLFLHQIMIQEKIPFEVTAKRTGVSKEVD